MSAESTYVERLGRELAAAGRRLRQEREEQLARSVSPHRGQGRRARLRATFALGGVVCAVVAVLAVLALSAGTQRAYAGWTPTPTQPASGQLAAAEAACLHGPLDAARGLEGASDPSERGAPPSERSTLHLGLISRVRPGGWQRTLSDTRGPYTTLIYQAAAGRVWGFCLARGSKALDANFGESFTALSAPAGKIHVFYMGQAGKSAEPYSYVNGEAGAGVTGVTLDLQDGEHVTASVENGWFLAWWPGSAKASDAKVQTASGTRAQSLGG